MAAEPEWAAHWDEAYAQGDTMLSWFQAAPEMSLRMLDAAGVTTADSVIDVGGGASPLAGALLTRGCRPGPAVHLGRAAPHGLTPRVREPPGPPPGYDPTGVNA